eukprot:scpid42028/ scgid15909/ 
MDFESLETLKRPQLQQLCKKFGLKATGKNTVLVAALQKHISGLVKSPLSSPAKSPGKAPKVATPKQKSPAPSPEVSPSHASPSPPRPGKAVAATKRGGGRRGRQPKGRKPPRSVSTSPCCADDVKDSVSEDVPADHAAAAMEVVVKRRVRGRKARKPSAGADDADSTSHSPSAAALAGVQSTKRRRSEVGSSPQPTPKRSRTVTATSPAATLTTSPSSPSKGVSVVVTKYSKTTSPRSGTKVKAAGTRSRGSSGSSAGQHTTPSSSRQATPVTSPSLSAAVAAVSKSKRASSSPLKSPVVSLTRSTRTPPTSAGKVTVSTNTGSGRKRSSATKNSGQKRSASKRGKQARSSAASPVQFSATSADSLSPPSGRSSRRSTFTVTPSPPPQPPSTSATGPSAARTSTGKRSRSGSRAGSLSAKSHDQSSASSVASPPTWQSPGVSMDAMKASILADLDQKVASKLPPAPVDTKIPRIGSLTSITGGGKGKPVSGKDWDKIHNKNFQRMKSIEDDLRSRQARREKLTASGKGSTLSARKPAPKPKTDSKSIPIFKMPDSKKKISFTFGGKAPTVVKAAVSKAATTKAALVTVFTGTSLRGSAAAAASNRNTPRSAIGTTSAAATAGKSSSATNSKTAKSSSAAPTDTTKNSLTRASMSSSRASLAPACTPMKPDDQSKSNVKSARRFSFASPGFKSPAAPKPKFDLKASLQRQLSYKPYAGPLKKKAEDGVKPSTSVSHLKSPSVKVFREKGSPAKEFKRPPVRDHRAESRQKLQQRMKSQRGSLAMANRGLAT